MDNLLALINQYGLIVYLILFGYSALKSGSLPLFAGYAAHTGVLDLMWVASAAFAGGYLGDECRFAFAKAYGDRWTHQPTWFGRLFRHAQNLANRYGKAYIFMYRYPKGLRTVGALPIGLTAMKWRQFTMLNASSALLWVLIMVGGGYSFGGTLDALGASSFTAFTLLLLLIFFVALAQAWRMNKIQSQANSAVNEPQRGTQP